VSGLRALAGTAASLGKRRPLSLSFTTSVGIQGLNVLTGVLLARALGPEGRGELAAVLLWPGLLALVGSLGVMEAVTYHAARSTAPLGRLLGSSLVLGGAQATVLITVGAVVVPRALASYGPDAVSAARAYLVYIALFFAALYLMAVISGLQRYGQFQVLRLLVVVLSAAGLVALAVTGALTVRTAVYAYLAANLVTAVAAAAMLRTWRADLGIDRALTSRLLAFGARSHGGNLASTLNERLDQLLISIFLTPASLGLYVVAVTLTSVAALVGSSTGMVALPSVASMPPGPERVRAARRLIHVTLLGSVAATVPLLALLPTIIQVFFGRAFLGAVGPARVLLVAAVALSVGRVLGAVLRAVGRPLDAGLAEAAALGVTVLGLAVLLPFLGLMGAAFTSLAAYLLSAGWMAARLARALRVSAVALLLHDRTTMARMAAAPPASGRLARQGGERR